MKNVELLVGAVAVLFAISTASANTWYVHPDSALNTIQAGLVLCADNDTVLVGPGTYVENLMWPYTQGIYLASELGPQATIIDGDYAGSVIVCVIGVDTTTIVTGFTIQHGWASDGGGITCTNSSPSLKNIIISQNVTTGGGGGIYCWASSPTLKNVLISGNTALGSGGGGILCQHGSSPTLENVSISGNSAYLRGGGIACDCSSPILRNVTLSDNYANNNGGGIDCYFSSPTLDDVRISGNSAMGGGGIDLNYSNPTLVNVIISDNSAMYDGGGGILCQHESSPILENISISGNYTYLRGGGIYCSYANPILSNVTLSDNYANCGGGGIGCYYSSPTLGDVTILDNYTSGGGGGIYCWESSPTLENVSISGNSAMGGGGIDLDYSSPSLADVTISSNTAEWGGGIYCEGFYSIPSLINVTISGNEAVDFGGGIYCYHSSLAVDSCTITNNTAGVVGGIYCVAGANPIIHYCEFANNDGWALYNEHPNLSINAEYNWWGDSTGPYHPDSNPGGLGDSIGGYVDFEPWLYWPIGIEELPVVKSVEIHKNLAATIFRGPLQLPEGKTCRVYDITGRIVEPSMIKPGIYFIEVDGVVVQKVVKVR